MCIRVIRSHLSSTLSSVRSGSSDTYYYAFHFSDDPRRDNFNRLLSFVCEHGRESFIKYLAFSPHSAVCAKNDWREASLITIENALVVRFLFLLLIHLIALGEALSLISSSNRVKNPYIKKCFLT